MMYCQKCKILFPTAYTADTCFMCGSKLVEQPSNLVVEVKDID